MELYNEDGMKAGIMDIIAWWLEKYPEGEYPLRIMEVRRQMLEIAKIAKEIVEEEKR